MKSWSKFQFFHQNWHFRRVTSARGRSNYNMIKVNHSDCPRTSQPYGWLRSSLLNVPTVLAVDRQPPHAPIHGLSLIIVANDDSRFAPGGDDAYYRNDPVKYDLNSTTARQPILMQCAVQ